MKLKERIRKLLQEIGTGHMMNTAYDTAWMVRLGELGDPIGEQGLAWLREHQLDDGSWGAPHPHYHHDRVICTLAAINALARRGRFLDRQRLRRAEVALEKETKLLGEDPAGETVGFELIVPTLMNEAKALGAIQREETEVLQKLTALRAAKLSRLPDGMINRFVTVAFSLEMAGIDGRDLFDTENLQEANGSVGHSPSATAYFALYVRRRDAKALHYLHEVTHSGVVPNVAPFDIFEQAWTLRNLALTEVLDAEDLALCEKHLDFLEKAWVPGKGVGFAAGYTPKDSDDTGLVYDVLHRFGRNVDFEAVQSYELETHFRCYSLETNPSISANIHILDALSQAGLPQEHPSIQKVLTFLKKVRNEKGYWYDKWHASPYYATSQAVIAGSKYPGLNIERAITWILNTQNECGAWGYYLPTAEETAYSLQALIVWMRQGGKVPLDTIKRGVDWLSEHIEPPYPPLWIGKCLYCPEFVIQSAVLSALLMGSQII